MKELVCDMCGSNNIIKQNGLFVCQACNTKYSIEEARKMMAGETVEINNEPIKMTYEELMNTELKLVLPADIYKWNDKYDVYEDMQEYDNFMRNLYDMHCKL